MLTSCGKQLEASEETTTPATTISEETTTPETAITEKIITEVITVTSLESERIYIAKATEVSLDAESILAVVDEKKVDKHNLNSILNQIFDDYGGFSEYADFWMEFMQYGYILQFNDTYYLYAGGNRRGEVYSIGIRVIDITKPKPKVNPDGNNYFIPDDSGDGILMASGKPNELYYGIYTDGDMQIPIIYGTNLRMEARHDIIIDIINFKYIYNKCTFADVDSDDWKGDILEWADNNPEALKQAENFNNILSGYIETIALLK